MPTNLPPEYFEVEERYRAATTPQEKIATLEELISTVPKHKGTDKLRADLRRRLSKLKESVQGQKRASRHVSAFQIDREGIAQVAVVGPANVGKSALVAALTNATPEVADYPYTTWTPSPGMLDISGVQIQLIDTPPLTLDYVEPALLDLIRRADLILLVIDLQSYPIEQLEDTIALLVEHRIAPERWRKRFEGPVRMTFRPLIVVVNKYDDESTDEVFDILCQLLEEEWPMVPLSAKSGRNLELLKRELLDKLEIIRVYAKPPGKEPDFSAPFVLKRGSTVEEFAAKVHKDFFEQLQSARVWGSGAFDGQMVSRDYVLRDGDIVELRL